MWKYCQNCGEKLNNDAKFCSRCGTRCESKVEPVAWEEVQSDTQMQHELKSGMAPEYMAAKWTELNWGQNDDVDSRFVKFNKGLSRPTYLKYYTNCFKTLMNEIQSDERGRLYFAGTYTHAKNPLLNAGDYTYILTDKRLIMAGVFSNLGSIVIPFNVFRMYSKNFTCAKKTLYLNELQDVTVEMVGGGSDALLFHAGDKSFRVVFAGRNITHRLCKEIHEVLDQLKDQQFAENVDKEGSQK